MNHFLAGALMMACGTIGLLFFKFWRKTQERLFFIFALAFWMMSIERVILALFDLADENQKYVYLIRLTAYIFIIWGIVDKNRFKR